MFSQKFRIFQINQISGLNVQCLTGTIQDQLNELKNTCNTLFDVDV